MPVGSGPRGDYVVLPGVPIAVSSQCSIVGFSDRKFVQPTMGIRPESRGKWASTRPRLDALAASHSEGTDMDFRSTSPSAGHWWATYAATESLVTFQLRGKIS